jgi:hypothetical protein
LGETGPGIKILGGRDGGSKFLNYAPTLSGGVPHENIPSFKLILAVLCLFVK